MKFLVDQIPTALATLQADQKVPTESFITQYDLSADQSAAIQRKAQLRSAITAAALGILLTVLLVAFVEKAMRRRRPGGDDPDGPVSGGAAQALDTHDNRHPAATYRGTGRGNRTPVTSRRNRRSSTRRPDLV
jgi:hypothetical protein